MNVVNARAKAIEILKNAVEVERDIALSQKKIAEIKNIDLKVVTSIEINKLKPDLSNSNKEIEKL